MRRLFAIALSLVVPFSGCSAATSAPDAHAEDAATVDAAVLDAALVDAGSDASLEMDAAESDDASVDDATTGDAFVDDASTDDAASDDAGTDAGTDADVDVGPTDAGIVRTEDPATHPARPPIAPFTTCTVVTAADAVSGSEHRLPCDPIAYPYLPPTSGPHYSQWAAFQTYADPVPWGFLVHAMEHGAVVLSYHCENEADCDPVRAELAAIVTDRGLDDVCRDEDTPQRIIIVPDPTLDVPIVATAWGHIYSATCLDPASLRAFVDAHYAMGPENFCFPGVDLSSTGWCP